MSSVSQAIRSHHRELVNTLTTQVAAIVEGRPEADPTAFATFLKQELLPHAMGEERHLYPAVDPLVKAYGQATATMSVDHEFIENYIRQIGEAAEAWRDAGENRRSEVEARLRRLALQLEAVLLLHLEKEERVYLPLFERYLSEEAQQQVLDGMHSAYQAEGKGASVKTELDVRQIPPPQRHPLILQTFESLAPGEAFVLINDHDPKPLYYQFRFEREGQFTWEYLEQGPEVWRVRIGRA
jgi:uncharacterized protein (DUF2249 family)